MSTVPAAACAIPVPWVVIVTFGYLLRSRYEPHRLNRGLISVLPVFDNVPFDVAVAVVTFTAGSDTG